MDMCSRCRPVFSIAVLLSTVTFVASVEYPVGGEATFRCDIKEANFEEFVYMLRRRAPGSESFVNIINYFDRKTGEWVSRYCYISKWWGLGNEVAMIELSQQEAA